MAASAAAPETSVREVTLLGSGAILNEVLKAAHTLAAQGIAATVYSVTSWSELARDITLPPKDIPVTVVRAAKTSPPYVTPRLVEALQDRPDFRLIEMDCHHMVPLARPAETAQLIRERLS